MFKRLLVVIALGAMVSGCGTSGSSPVASNDVNNTTTNSTVNNTSTPNNTSANNTSANSTPDNNTVSTNDTSQNQTSPGSGSASSITTADQSVALVKQVYADKIAADPKLKVVFDHNLKDGTHQVYVVQVYDDMSDHVATIAWVEVRDDGKLQNLITPGGWVNASDFSVDGN